MRKKIKALVILMMISIGVLVLTACGVGNDPDPIAEDYLVRAIDAIENQEADTSYAMFADGFVTREQWESTLEQLGKVWETGDYTYELEQVALNSSVTTAGKLAYKSCIYKVKHNDHDYVIEVDYIKDQGLVGFHLNY